MGVIQRMACMLSSVLIPVHTDCIWLQLSWHGVTCLNDCQQAAHLTLPAVCKGSQPSIGQAPRHLSACRLERVPAP